MTIDPDTVLDTDRPRRRGAPLRLALLAGLLGGTGALVIAVLHSSGTRADRAGQPTGGQVSYSLAGGEPSCAPLSAEWLAGASAAFSATATSADPQQFVLSVDHWYTGGDASQVILANPQQEGVSNSEAMAFTPGTRYLVSVEEGVVNACTSVEWSADAAAEFEKAFGP